MRLTATRLSMLIAVVLIVIGTLATWQSRRLEHQGAQLLTDASAASDSFAQTFQEDQQVREFSLLDERRAVLLRGANWEVVGRIGFVVSLLALGAAWLAYELTREHDESAMAGGHPATVPVPARVRAGTPRA